MFFTVHYPEPPADLLIESITYFSDYSANHEVERLLPDGHVDFIVNLTSKPKHTFENDSLLVKQTFNTGWISGSRKNLLSIDSGGLEDSMMVVRLRLGTAFSIFKIPQHELSDQVFEADDLLGADFDRLRDRIMTAHFAETKIRIMEEFLLTKAQNNLENPAIIKFAFDRLSRMPGQESIQEIARKSGYSHKHFIELFRKYSGMTPKEFLKVMRFQKVLIEIERSGEIDWARLALDCGYYDQSHFIREFKKFSGFNPGQYLTAKGEHFNYIPVK